MGLPGHRPQADVAATSPAYACLPFNLIPNYARAQPVVTSSLSGIGYKNGKVKVRGKSLLITEFHKNAKIPA